MLQNKQTGSFQVFNASGKVAQELIELLRLTGIEHKGTIVDIVAQTQASWLREPGIESWQMPERVFVQHDEIVQLFQELNFYQEVGPIQKQYQYLMLLGTTFHDMIMRMKYAASLWNAGIRFEQIALLTGARPAASEQFETAAELERFTGQAVATSALVETDFMKAVYCYSALPVAMRALPTQLIDVPAQQALNGSIRRPNTSDTIEYWLRTGLMPGSVLAVSNQPYVYYQQSVLRTLLPSSYPVEVVGCANPEEQRLVVLLDTLARILYQEKLRLKL